MRNVSKQFVEKVTGLYNNQFHLTRLRLTIIYAVLLLSILTISSVITHSLFSNRLEHRFRGNLILQSSLPIQMDILFRNQVRQELVVSLVLVNGVLFFGAVGLSYVLAGITLHPIQEAYERQRRFLSDASHELRTPLAILQTDLENEFADSKKKERKKEIASHLEEVARMSNIVKDLLLISRLDRNERAVHFRESVDLKDVVNTAVHRLAGYAAQRDVKLIVSPLVGQNAVTVQAHQEHVLQALTNLIKNGIDYNKKDGTVTVDVKHGGGQAVITVRDTGIGIPAEEIPKLFDRFYRVDQSRSRAIGGSGLGLSIVRSIAHTYDGTVSVQSIPDAGTVVTLSFPLSSKRFS